MCGVAGIVHDDRSTRADAAILDRMNEALRHRGPDDGQIWTHGPAGIAARRLSIRDIDHGRQPMANEDASWVVALNGEIYNTEELRYALESKGYTFRTRCDTEILLRAMEAWGEDAVTRFNGMFAFAAYDRARHRLILARDRLGIKPLFYAQSGGTLYFASELDSLLQSGAVDDALNPSALDAYLTYLYVPAPDTIYRGASKLRPGQLLTYERGALRLQTYWQPRFDLNPAWSLHDAADRFRELFTDSVRLRRVADVPLGAFLSGGLDSSAVVAALAQQSPQPVQTFSIGFNDSAANELPYAAQVASRYGTDHTEEIATPDLVDLAPRIAKHFGEPFADSSAIPTWLVSELARRSVTVALSGDGGDELFAGYSWLRMNRLVNRLRALPKPLRSAARAALASLPHSANAGRAQRLLADTFLDHRESFRRRETCFNRAERLGLIAPQLHAEIASANIDRFAEHAANDWPDDDWMLHQDLRMYLPDDILTKVDRMSMAHGLEVRVPFLDHRLVEFAFTLPFALKLHRGQSKRVVKHAFRNDLPNPCLQQRKRGFAIPIDRWFRAQLAAVYRERVLSPTALSADWLDTESLRTLLDSHIAGRTNAGHRLWAVLMIEEWLRYHKHRAASAAERHRASA